MAKRSEFSFSIPATVRSTMRFQHAQASVNQHTEIVTACCWTPENDVITCSDDNTIVRWRMDGEVVGKVASVDTFVTSVDWVPSVGKQGADMFVIACTDGTFRIMSKNGREEKKVQASDAGAIISLKWNYDGTALVTAGEDGSVKVYSRSGNLRSTLANTGSSIVHPFLTCVFNSCVGNAVYAVCWGPDNDQILFTNSKNLVIKTIQVGRKDIQWKAHDGPILCIDWNPINNRVISGGEDRVFRVWDGFGRQLYQSPVCEHVITSIAWSPKGDMFAVGAFNMLRLCDKTGWSYCRERPKCGSLMDISWASDGTQLVAAGGNSSTLFAQVVDRHLQWNKIEVIEMSLGYGFLIVCTATQCFIYNFQNWNTPHIFDLRAAVNFILQSECHFITVDNFHGIQVYSYEGRAISNPKFNGMHVEFLHRHTVSLSIDTVSILDHSDRKTIRSFDINTGKALPITFTHSLDVLELALSHYGPSTDRKLFFIDSNRDLHLSRLSHKGSFKLQAQVDSAAWNDSSEMLVALSDAKVRSIVSCE
ncbi:hypothetical protein DYB32_004381 [Aphanomyces invadans]|uniref:IFT80 second beta-propeller domain-containing protein n=1 Tax=Aphanomyces invadans TaxID=157072 RepID=A0A418AXT2_9STRA|nr:hypothetical protein DYB32_004381 [Aphanomyces invadans]